MTPAELERRAKEVSAAYVDYAYRLYGYNPPKDVRLTTLITELLTQVALESEAQGIAKRTAAVEAAVQARMNREIKAGAWPKGSHTVAMDILREIRLLPAAPSPETPDPYSALVEAAQWVRMNSGIAADGNHVDPAKAHAENCERLDKAFSAVRALRGGGGS